MDGLQKNSAAYRKVCDIASDILSDWTSTKSGKPGIVHPTAKPYLYAMLSLNSVEDNYGLDSGRDTVCRFLSNASQYKGGRSKELKNELRAMVGLKLAK